MNNCVTVQLKTDKIIIKINEEAEQNEIVECLKQKMPDLKKLYQEDTTPIYVVGKVMKNKETDEIQEVIKEEINVKVEFESPKMLGLHGIKKTYSKEIGTSETMFHKGALRSGQKIEFEGSITVLGDVNDGAEVVAGENIVILGDLRGLAHAGAKGNKEAFIAAGEIQCPQIRISNIIKELNWRAEQEQTQIYKYAYVNEENQIVLE